MRPHLRVLPGGAVPVRPAAPSRTLAAQQKRVERAEKVAAAAQREVERERQVLASMRDDECSEDDLVWLRDLACLQEGIETPEPEVG